MRSWLAIGVFVCTLLTACAEQSEQLSGSNNSSDFSIPVPRAIREALIDPSELELTLTANGETVSTTSSVDNSEWTGTMTVTHGQSIELSIVWSIRGTEVATHDLNVPSVISNQEVHISSDDYTILDDDGDNFPNFEEVLAQPPTDIDDPDSVPIQNDDTPKLSDPDPASLDLSADVSESALDTISFSNDGSAVLNFIVSSSQSWLKADPSGGSVPAGAFQTLNVTADCDAIDETRTATLTLGGNGGSKSVPVSLKCTKITPPPMANLAPVEPESLSLSAQVSNKDDGEIIIHNNGTSELDFSVESNQSWLTAEPPSGSIEAGKRQTVIVTASCNTTIETRNGTLTIKSNGGDDTVSVSIECSAAPVGIIGNVSPESLNLSAQIPEKVNGIISFENVGTARLNFTIDDTGESSERITITPINGSVDVNESQVLDVEGSCESVSAGTLSGQVQISNNDNNNNKTVSVSIKCSAAPGVVSRWSGDGNAMDVVDGNNGTLQGGTTFTPGIRGQSFSFDGVDDYVSIPFNQNYNFAPNGQFSIHAWINPGRFSGVQAIVVRDVFKWDWGLWLSGNRFLTGHHNRNLTGQIQAQIGTWIHVAVTYDNGVHKLYVDGVLDTLSGLQSPISQSNNDLAFGRRITGTTSDHYEGLLDEVAIFDRALSQPEIQAFAARLGIHDK